jgi:hypothetical protein
VLAVTTRGTHWPPVPGLSQQAEAHTEASGFGASGAATAGSLSSALTSRVGSLSAARLLVLISTKTLTVDLQLELARSRLRNW